MIVGTDGSLWSWGSGYSELIRDGLLSGDAKQLSPVKIDWPTGYDKAPYVDGNGDLWTWGYNDTGQVGDGTTNDRTTPHKVEFKQ